MSELKVAVYGVGGVGGYFGAVLARAGNPVSLIARGAHLQAIREKGLRIQTPKEEFTITPAAASDNPSDIGRVVGNAITSSNSPTFCWQNSVPCRIPDCDWAFARLVM